MSKHDTHGPYGAFLGVRPVHPLATKQLLANWTAVEQVLRECYEKAKEEKNTQQANNIECVLETLKADCQARTNKEMYADEVTMQLALAQSLAEIDKIKQPHLDMLIASDDPLNFDMDKVPGFSDSVKIQYQKLIDSSNQARTPEHAATQITNLVGKLNAKQEKRKELLRLSLDFRVKIDAWKMYGKEMLRRKKDTMMKNSGQFLSPRKKL